MANLENKIEDKKLQLGSLNDAIRDTNKTLESKYDEKDRIQVEIGALEVKRDSLIGEIGELQENIVIESATRKEKTDKEVTEQEGKIGKLITLALNFENKAEQLRREVEYLKSEEKRLRKTLKELDKREKELFKLSEKVDEQKETSKKLKGEHERLVMESKNLGESVKVLKEKLRDEKSAHNEWLSRTKKRILSDQDSAKALVKKWEGKNKDILAIMKRLKRRWKTANPGVPFPAI